MRKIVFYGMLGLFLVWGLAGCSVLNPYGSEFQCPDVDKGKCVSMQKAYNGSLSPEQDVDESGLVHNDKCTDCAKDGEGTQKAETAAADTKKTTENSRYNYQSTLYNKIAAIIGNPLSPMVAAPNVMRVLIMSYTGPENILYSYRYVYTFVTEPKWIYSTTVIGD